MLARGVGNERASSSCGAAFYFLVRSFRCKGVLIRWQLHRTESNNQRRSGIEIVKTHANANQHKTSHWGDFGIGVGRFDAPSRFWGGPFDANAVGKTIL